MVPNAAGAFLICEFQIRRSIIAQERIRCVCDLKNETCLLLVVIFHHSALQVGGIIPVMPIFHMCSSFKGQNMLWFKAVSL